MKATKNIINNRNSKISRLFPKQESRFKKPMIIAAISLGAVIILSLLVFFASQFVGKAFFTDLPDTAGIVKPVDPIYTDSPFTLTVKANIGTKETVAMRFVIDLPADLTCNSVTSLIGWTAADGAVTNEAKCDGSNVVFESSTLNRALYKSGTFDIAEITFAGAPAGSYDLKFSSFEIIDFSNHQPIISLTAFDATVDIEEPVAPPIIAEEICNGEDDDLDGNLDVLKNLDGTFTAVCNTNESCGNLDNVCPAHSSCTEINTYPQGALCSCDSGWASCAGTSCGIDVLTNPSHCGSCDNICESGQLCQDGACVAENITPATNVTEPAPTPTPTPTPSAGGGGGGPSCVSNWTCGTWTYCNASLQQSRICNDAAGCSDSTKEIRDCAACEESWICGQWSTCASGTQSRQCYDEHNCGTVAKKPSLQQTCVTGPAVTPPVEIIRAEAFLPEEPSFWEKYSWWILGLAILILLAAAGVLLYYYVFKPKKTVLNMDEFRTWVKAELKRKVPRDKIREIVKKTDWTDKELNQVFNEIDMGKRARLLGGQPIRPASIGKPTFGQKPKKGLFK